MLHLVHPSGDSSHQPVMLSTKATTTTSIRTRTRFLIGIWNFRTINNHASQTCFDAAGSGRGISCRSSPSGEHAPA
jgi:hypothetical protein